MVSRRELGPNYLRFSQVAANGLRMAIKPEARDKYPGQGEASIKKCSLGGAKKEAGEGK